QDELMRVPLAGIRAILSRNHLGIVSEGAVYEFMLRWACSQYSNSEERHKILSSRLLPLVPRVLGFLGRSSSLMTALTSLMTNSICKFT
uniref:BACK domain-containing protein n=2 Tax=Aegilops tauschii subsp. strangulata TaxID=200361 RepID=A0A453LLY4_AEGTS